MGFVYILYDFIHVVCVHLQVFRVRGRQPHEFFNSKYLFCLEPQKTLASKPVKGKKRDKERITVGLCVNATGSNKMLPVVVGKSKRLRCFGKTFDPNLLLHYYNNTKAWMTGTIFEDWIMKWNNKLKKVG